MEQIQLSMNKDLYNKMLIHLYNKETTMENYIYELIKKDLNSIVILENGFIFFREKEKIFLENKKEIHLTKMEYKIFQLLLDNVNEVVLLKDIYNLWEDKNPAIHTVRNRIMFLRIKLYPKLISNISNIGYKMNL